MLFTIGYEGRALDELIAELAAARVERVIDVRQLPLSRRRGFSKTPLAAALAAQGIEYVHLRQAGNPFRAEKAELPRDELLAKYAAHLTKGIVDDVAAAAKGRCVSLLCYERHPGACHRSVLAKRLARRLHVKVVDL